MLPQLLKNHVYQFNSASCSVASTAVVINAIFDFFSIPHPKIDQKELLDRIRVIHWKERVSPSGHNGKRGLPIQKLEKAVLNSLKEYQIPFNRVRTAYFDYHSTHTDSLKSLKGRLRLDLASLCQNPRHIIIAHFNQGLFTRDIHLPHISPVGAYDPYMDRVLILDVDPEQSRPYWVPFNLFFKSLKWDYKGLLKKYGYTGGGYISIQLADPNR